MIYKQKDRQYNDQKKEYKQWSTNRRTDNTMAKRKSTCIVCPSV
jgi:hypothetical protein